MSSIVAGKAIVNLLMYVLVNGQVESTLVPFDSNQACTNAKTEMSLSFEVYNKYPTPIKLMYAECINQSNGTIE